MSQALESFPNSRDPWSSAINPSLGRGRAIIDVKCDASYTFSCPLALLISHGRSDLLCNFTVYSTLGNGQNFFAKLLFKSNNLCGSGRVEFCASASASTEKGPLLLPHPCRQGQLEALRYIDLLAKSLLPPDSRDVDLAYQDFCNVITTAAKNSIPRGRRNNHILCWDAECENFHRTFLQSPKGSDTNRAATRHTNRAATCPALLLNLDKKPRDR